MLRRQNPKHDPMSFLGGAGEMASRIREFDWASHPFGAIADWPQSLRAALGICLNSAFPTAIYWGRDLRLLYNDAWSVIPGPRHPEALGAPASEVWSDIWHVIEPQFFHLIETGEGVFFENQMLPMRRYGVEEETYWNYSFTPIRDEAGAIVGVFNSGSETTEQVISRSNSEFLLELDGALGAGTEEIRLAGVATERLGRHLAAKRIEMLAPPGVGGSTDWRCIAGWTEGEGPDAAPARLSVDLGGAAMQALDAGNVVRLDGSSDRQDGETLERLAAAGIAATLLVPMREDGATKAVLVIQSGVARHWTDLDVLLVRNALERTVRRLERAKAAARETVMAHEIDHRARNMLAVIQSIVKLTSADDVPTYRGKLLDRIVALANVHTLLAERRWDGVSLRDVISREIAPYGGEGSERVRIAGPDIQLSPSDAQVLSMVFHELITNAAKHGAMSHAAGRLSVTWQLSDGGRTMVQWSESGGAPQRRAPSQGRSGFGSKLLKNAIERQLSGTMERSLTSEGIDFLLTFNLARGGAAAAAANTGERGGKTENRTVRSILIVEDEQIVAIDLSDMVRDFGFEVAGIAGSVAEAMHAIKESPPDIAVLDANLAGESTEPVANELVSRNIPVIVATGYQQLGEGNAVLAGLPRIQKPFSPHELERMLSECAGHNVA